MAIKLMYITNRPEIACIAQSVGVDRIFVDMEYIGKEERQPGDTVKCHHTVEDVKRVRACLDEAELLVRVNPIHEATSEWCSSRDEIDAVIDAGADIVMLPYFKTVEEARAFVEMVGGRARTLLLIETPEAVELVDEILALPGIDEVYIGLNDLSLGYKKKFMFEVLSDGTVDELAHKIRRAGIPFGFGGLASLDKGMVPGKMVLKEHYRLGSTSVILSRSFCNSEKIGDLDIISSIFNSEVRRIREFEERCEEHAKYFSDNRDEMSRIIKTIAGGK